MVATYMDTQVDFMKEKRTNIISRAFARLKMLGSRWVPEIIQDHKW